MVRAVFLEKNDMDYRLWGSACIFLGIGIMFSFLCMITEVLLPGSLHLNIPLSTATYIHFIDHSFYMLSCVEHLNGNMEVIIKNISVLQGTIVNLCVVVVVARLLSKD